MRNLFCQRSDIDSEADVESLFIDRLLEKLRYPDNRVKRKDSLEKIKVARGSKKESYTPDYVLLDRRRRPVVVIDAKSPNEKPGDYHYQVSGYALGLNRRYLDENPVRYILVTNGLLLILWLWDSDMPVLRMSFKDFEEDNAKFVQLRSLLSYGALDIVRVTEDVFTFERPNLNELKRVFNDCHVIIRNKEAYGPTDAFYEFAKLMFVKLREDRRIADMIAVGRTPTEQDFNLSVAWIQDQTERGVSDNPVGELLFRRIRDDLESQIKLGDKKRIFDKNELLHLRADTVIQVVERLQHFDLHGIDEDLNGRMFETFLNATVRGKELGQFFTPRSVVKLMSYAADLRVDGKRLPVVLDGCCGSGGFLIEAMAAMVHAIDARADLAKREKTNLKKQLYKEHLFGIDKAEKIARIARLNMYLHGDGGSTIYATDTLDKKLQPPKGLSDELSRYVKELIGHLITDGLRFDVVLTNPPFSMSYKKGNEDEERILEQYDIAVTAQGKVSANEKSNVLFLERYCDLLADGGELLTVIDNTVLNGKDSQRYRDYILKNFIIKQIIALPFNTFFQAQANVQTSAIHLKKRVEGDEQAHVFMAILNNIGHDDHQRYTPERDNVPRLMEVFALWRRTGNIEHVFEDNTVKSENLACPFQVFVVPPEELNTARLDAFYYAPDLHNTRAAMTKRAEEGHIAILKATDFAIIPTLKGDEVKRCRGNVFRYFEIGDVTPEGAITKYTVDTFENLPTRARLRVRTNDVIFAKNNSSRGTALIIPPEFDGHLVTTGFIGVRPKDNEEALLLWSIFTSETFRKQIYYLAITAVQPEVREDIFREQFMLPVPMRKAQREKLIAHAREVRKLQQKTRRAVEDTRRVAEKVFEGE